MRQFREEGRHCVPLHEAPARGLRVPPSLGTVWRKPDRARSVFCPFRTPGGWFCSGGMFHYYYYSATVASECKWEAAVKEDGERHFGGENGLVWTGCKRRNRGLQWRLISFRPAFGLISCDTPVGVNWTPSLPLIDWLLAGCLCLRGLRNRRHYVEPPKFSTCIPIEFRPTPLVTDKMGICESILKRSA